MTYDEMQNLRNYAQNALMQRGQVILNPETLLELLDQAFEYERELTKVEEDRDDVIYQLEQELSQVLQEMDEVTDENIMLRQSAGMVGTHKGLA
jgi:hypothetical protein